MITYVYPDVQLEQCNLTDYKDFPGRVFIASEKGVQDDSRQDARD